MFSGLDGLVRGYDVLWVRQSCQRVMETNGLTGGSVCHEVGHGQHPWPACDWWRAGAGWGVNHHRDKHQCGMHILARH
jgi:hypothetical protein